MKKKIRFSILVIILILFASLMYINQLTTPLPENKRNMSTTNIKMVVHLKDGANRTPIVRTYTRDEFNQFNENKVNKIKDLVNGNIEGDMPALTITDDIGKLELSFESVNEVDEPTKIIPDDIPRIKISVPYSREESKIINDSLIESKETEGLYLYEIKSYLDEEDLYYTEGDDFVLESIFIEIDYEINKEGYVSIFAINTIEYKD